MSRCQRWCLATSISSTASISDVCKSYTRITLSRLTAPSCDLPTIWRQPEFSALILTDTIRHIGLLTRIVVVSA